MQREQQNQFSKCICFNLLNVFVQISNGCSRSRWCNWTDAKGTIGGATKPDAKGPERLQKDSRSSLKFSCCCVRNSHAFLSWSSTQLWLFEIQRDGGNQSSTEFPNGISSLERNQYFMAETYSEVGIGNQFNQPILSYKVGMCACRYYLFGHADKIAWYNHKITEER